MNSKSKKYEWTPDWKGNLRNAYKNPSKIKVYETKMPNGLQQLLRGHRLMDISDVCMEMKRIISLLV